MTSVTLLISSFLWRGGDRAVLVVREYKDPFIFPLSLKHAEIIRVGTNRVVYTTSREDTLTCRDDDLWLGETLLERKERMNITSLLLLRLARNKKHELT